MNTNALVFGFKSVLIYIFHLPSWVSSETNGLPFRDVEFCRNSFRYEESSDPLLNDLRFFKFFFFVSWFSSTIYLFLLIFRVRFLTIFIIFNRIRCRCFMFSFFIVILLFVGADIKSESYNNLIFVNKLKLTFATLLLYQHFLKMRRCRLAVERFRFDFLKYLRHQHLSEIYIH